jgi:hypothetical protein
VAYISFDNIKILACCIMHLACSFRTSMATSCARCFLCALASCGQRRPRAASSRASMTMRYAGSVRQPGSHASRVASRCVRALHSGAQRTARGWSLRVHPAMLTSVEHVLTRYGHCLYYRSGRRWITRSRTSGGMASCGLSPRASSASTCQVSARAHSCLSRACSHKRRRMAQAWPVCPETVALVCAVPE